MTPDDVHDAVFHRPRAGRRGYRERDVDELLDRVEATLRDPAHPEITRDELRGAALGRTLPGQRSYDTGEVDSFLDRIVLDLPISASKAS